MTPNADEGTRIQLGSHVLARDAFGEWHRMAALSGVEPTHCGRRKMHDFPVVWVASVKRPGVRIPWPAEDVLLAAPGVPDDFGWLPGNERSEA